MAGPWERYAEAPAAPAAGGKPWEKYGGGSPSEPVSDPLSVPDAVPRGTKPPGQPDSGFDPNAAVQAGVSMASSIPAAFAGNVTALVSALMPSNFGTQEGAARATQAGSKVQEAMTYQPPSEKAREYAGNVAGAFEGSKLSGLGPLAFPVAQAGAATAKPAAQGVRAGATRAMAKDIGADGLSAPPAAGELAAPPGARFASGGSAAIPEETLRRQRAEQLPVPIKLTKGQATRSFEDQRFERETAKDGKIGEPIRQRFAEQNEAMDRNLYAFIDQTGAEAPDLRGAGLTTDAALTSRAQKMRKEYKGAYDAAEKAGELVEPVKSTELVKWVNENRSSAKLAPVISAIEDELIRLKGAAKTKDGTLVAGRIPLNDLEKTRKMAVRLGNADETNGHFASEANKVIDAMTEGKGGEEYAKARGLFKKYADEFKSQGVVKKLMATKPGTTDRAVAFEDVFKHSILNSSYDEALGLRRTLQKEGELGHQAWKELQGQTVNYLRNTAFEGAARDVRGNPIMSPAKLDKAIRELDKDGKLDMILTKKGAQQLRELNDLAKDVYTAPPGAVNTSNTSSVIMQALDNAPVAGWLTKGIEVLRGELKNRKVKKQVREHLADPSELAPPP